MIRLNTMQQIAWGTQSKEVILSGGLDLEKKTFVTKQQIEEIVKTYPTPFHIYAEKGIRENARRLRAAYSWNKGFTE